MLKTVEGIMKPGGVVQFNEPLVIETPQHVLVTLLDKEAEGKRKKDLESQGEEQRKARLKFSGIFDSGLTDVSQNVDKYLYE